MFLRILLFPFALLYDGITRLRNHLYNIGMKPSVGFEIPVIAVGNLSVGGTGKTPMIEYLIQLFKDKKIATLSRGYGRKTKGFKIATPEDTPQTLGDEPIQFYNKFKDNVCVTVGEDRVSAIPFIMAERPDCELILLDDAFQHRRVKAGFNIVLTDFNRPFFQDYLLPAGRLREARKGASRADIVVVTKCPPSLDSSLMHSIESEVQRYTTCSVFFAGIKYGLPERVFGVEEFSFDKVVLITGIANPKPLMEYATSVYNIIEHISFPDHHHYKVNDIHHIVSRFPSGTCLLTTEKDMVKLLQFDNNIFSLPLFYLPMEIYFLKNGEKFDTVVKEFMARNSKNVASGSF